MEKTVAWKDRSLRIVDFIPPAPDEYEKLDLKEQFQIRKELGFNTEHVEVHDISEGESGITYYPSDCAVQTRKNILQEISDSYDSLGVYPIVYFNVHWLAESLAKLHPEWEQRSQDGKRIDSAYGSGSYSCINSPFREYAFQTIRNLAKHNIKGVFLDGPFFRVEGCYCPSCQELFSREYGYAIPDWKSNDTAKKRDHFRFKRESIARFMKEANEVLKQRNPDTMIYMNSPQLVPTKYCSRDNRLTIQYQDMLLAEGGFLGDDLRRIPIWKPAATAQLLETQAEGKPYCVAIAGRLAPWSRYLLSSAETWITHAMAAAHGANTWYGVYNDNNLDQRMETVKEINHFFNRNEEYFTGTKSIANVALLWSYATANEYQSSVEETDFTAGQERLSDREKGDARGSFMGWYDGLSRSRIPFDIIDDQSLLDGSFKKYSLIILPNVSVLDEAGVNLIKDYVQKGGHIISSFDTSLYDEDGNRRNQPLLGTVFGIKTLENIRVCKYDHIEIEQGNKLLNGIDQSVIPAAMLGTSVIPDDKAVPVMSYREHQRSRYCELPAKSSHPFILDNKYGKGRSLYFSGNVGKFYETHALPEYRKMISNAVRELAAIPVAVKTDVELESIHVSMRKQGGNRILIHLVNYTGSMTRPISGIITLKDIQVEIRIPDRICTVKSLRNNRILDCHHSNGCLYIQLPELKEYDVLAVDL